MNITELVGTLQDSLASSAAVVMALVPKLAAALLLLLLGYLLGRLVASGTARVLNLIGVDRLFSRTALQGILERAGTKKSLSQILGIVGFWVVFLLFLISAAETLSLASLSKALTDLTYYMPKVGIAALIVLLGMLAANISRELISMACSSAGIAQGPIVAQAFYVAALLLIVVTAINQLGVDTSLLNTTILLLLGGLIAGAALSFGLGARTAVANLIAAHYLQPVLRVGQRISIGTHHGEVVAVTPIAVILATDEGRVVVPASRFTETTTTIRPPEA